LSLEEESMSSLGQSGQTQDAPSDTPAEEPQDAVPAGYRESPEEAVAEAAEQWHRHHAALAEHAAELPQSLVTETLADVPVGKVVYTVPWMITVDHSGRCWIAEDCSFSLCSGGTVTVALTRDEHGFRAHLLKRDHTWSRGSLSPSQQYFPITELIL
jgi:hypothetical protein